MPSDGEQENSASGDEGETISGDRSTSSSDDDIVSAVIYVGPYLQSVYANERRHDSILQGAAYYNELMASGNDSRFYDSARMQRTTFLSLLASLERTDKLKSSAGISSGEKLMMTIHVLTRSTNRVISERWQHSGSTVSQVVHEVLGAAAIIQDDMITRPSAETPQHVRSSSKFYPYFSNCIGAIDGMHKFIYAALLL